jgi:hypothetical protein
MDVTILLDSAKMADSESGPFITAIALSTENIEVRIQRFNLASILRRPVV